MRLSLYVPADTAVHRLDPRAKLGALFLGAGTMLLFNEPVFLLGPLAAVCLLAAAARVTRPFLVGLFVVVVVGGLSFLFWPLFLGLRGLGGAGAWRLGAGMGLRLVTMLLLGLVILLTTRMEELLAAFGRLGVPYPVVFALGLTFRLMPALLATANHVVEAQRLRGLRFDEGGLVTRARRYVPLLVPILAGTLRGATRMAWALDAKGFGADRPRSPYLVLRMRVADWAVLALSVAWAVAAVRLRLEGIGYRPYAGY